MELRKIKVGKWYETNVGEGECVRVGGTHPASVQIVITYPLPRGKVNVIPRDVKQEVPARMNGNDPRPEKA